MINVVLIEGKKFIIVSDLYNGEGEVLGSYASMSEVHDSHPDASTNIKDFVGDMFDNKEEQVEPTE